MSFELHPSLNLLRAKSKSELIGFFLPWVHRENDFASEIGRGREELQKIKCSNVVSYSGQCA